MSDISDTELIDWMRDIIPHVDKKNVIITHDVERLIALARKGAAATTTPDIEKLRAELERNLKEDGPNHQVSRRELETIIAALEAAATLQPGEGWKETLLDLLNPLHGSLDKQLYDERSREEWEIPPDCEHHVIVTEKMERDLTKAVLILEGKVPAPVIPSAGGEDDDEGLGLEAKRPVNLSPAPAPQGMEVLERVARAIYGAKWDHWRPGWKEHFDDPEWDKQDRDMAFLQARAAIAALQEQKP